MLMFAFYRDLCTDLNLRLWLLIFAVVYTENLNTYKIKATKKLKNNYIKIKNKKCTEIQDCVFFMSKEVIN